MPSFPFTGGFPPSPLGLALVDGGDRSATPRESDNFDNLSARYDAIVAEIMALYAKVSVDGTFATADDSSIPTALAVKTFVANTNFLGTTGIPSGIYLNVMNYGAISGTNPANDATNGPINAAALLACCNAAQTLGNAGKNVWVYVPVGVTIRTALNDLFGDNQFRAAVFLSKNVGLWVDGSLIQCPTTINAWSHSQLFMNRNPLAGGDGHMRIDGTGVIDGNSPNQPTTGVSGGTGGIQASTTCASGQTISGANFTLNIGSGTGFYSGTQISGTSPGVVSVMAGGALALITYTAVSGATLTGCNKISGAGTTTDGTNVVANGHDFGKQITQYCYHGGASNAYMGHVGRLSRVDDVTTGAVTLQECTGNGGQITPTGSALGTPCFEANNLLVWKFNRLRMIRTKVYSSGTSCTGVGPQVGIFVEIRDCEFDGNPTFTPNLVGKLYSNSHAIALWRVAAWQISGGYAVRYNNELNLEDGTTDGIADGFQMGLYQAAGNAPQDALAPFNMAHGCIATGGENVNSFAGAGVLTVNDTRGFAVTNGTIYVPTGTGGVATVTYTAKTLTTFTGCTRTAGGTGTATAGGIVKQTVGALIGHGNTACNLDGSAFALGRIKLIGCTMAGSFDTTPSLIGSGLYQQGTIDELVVQGCHIADNNVANIRITGTVTRGSIDAATLKSTTTNTFVTPTAAGDGTGSTTTWKNTNSLAAQQAGILTAGQPVPAIMTPPLTSVSGTNWTQVSPFPLQGILGVVYRGLGYLTSAINNSVTAIPVDDLSRFTRATLHSSSASVAIGAFAAGAGDVINVQTSTQGFNPHGGTILVATTGAVAVLTYTGVAVVAGVARFTGCTYVSGGTTTAAAGNAVCPQFVVQCESEQMQIADVYAGSGAGNLTVAARGTINSTAAAAHPINARVSAIGVASLSVGGVAVTQPVTAQMPATIPIPRSTDTISLTGPDQTLVPEVQYALAGH